MKSVSQKTLPLIKVGKVVQAHSLKGEVKVHLFSGEAAWLSQLKTVELRNADTTQSFEITKAKLQGSIALLKLTGVEDRTAAEKLKGFELWVSTELLQSKEGEKIYLREILGFKIVSSTNEELGIVRGFDSNSLQDLLVVEVKTGTESFSALVPFVKPFLQKIDYKEKIIIMDLPEGLLEANREI